MSRIPESISQRLTLPVIAAPMLRISGIDLVTTVTQEGAIGAFPTVNARTPEQLDDWLTQMDAVSATGGAPYCPNLIMRHPDLKEHLGVLAEHEVEMVITSVGSPAPIMPTLNDMGALVLADVATLYHAHKAAEAGVDGLILLTAGAGGQTGWMNPFAFVRAVRDLFDGIIVLAGGVTDGLCLRAAEVLGCDLAYMGTKFIATDESMATPGYRNMLVDSEMDDVVLTRAFTGLETNMLLPSIVAAGLNPDDLNETISVEHARERYGSSPSTATNYPRRWQDVWSAGHSVSGISSVESATELITKLRMEYESSAHKNTSIQK